MFIWRKRKGIFPVLSIIIIISFYISFAFNYFHNNRESTIKLNYIFMQFSKKVLYLFIFVICKYWIYYILIYLFNFDQNFIVIANISYINIYFKINK